MFYELYSRLITKSDTNKWQRTHNNGHVEINIEKHKARKSFSDTIWQTAIA